MTISGKQSDEINYIQRSSTMKKALIPFLLSAIILSCGCDTNTEQLSIPENSSVTDSKEDIQTTATSSEQLDFTSSGDNSEVKPDDNTIVFNSVTKYFPVSDTAEYEADAVLPDYFPVIYTSRFETREYVGTTVPIDASIVKDDYGAYINAEAEGIDPDSKAPVTKNVDLYLIDGMSSDFAFAAKFEGDNNYYAYININNDSHTVSDLFEGVADSYTVLEDVEKDDGTDVSKIPMTSDEVMNVWNALFNNYELSSSVENRCEEYGYENQEKDFDSTTYTMSFYINGVNLPSMVTFGLNGDFAITIGTVVYDSHITDSTVYECVKLIDPDTVPPDPNDDTLESIELTDEQKQVITTLYEDYTKPAYVFFNRNFEIKDVPEMFKGTEYEFERVTLTKDELPEELIKICDEDTETHSYPGSFIKYTGSAVNTKEKLKNEMSKYFTDKFINNALGYENSDDPHFYSWEQDGAVYRQCPDTGGALPLSDNYAKLYVKEYNETDDKIDIKMLYSFTEGDNKYKSYYYITLEKEAAGGFKLDDFYFKRTSMDGEEYIDFPVHNFYSKGTLVF